MAQQSIDFARFKMHKGSRFFVRESNAVTGSGSRIYVITTPDTTTWGHLQRLYVNLAGAGSVTLTEEISTSADGTAMTEVNRNRNSTATAALVVTHTPTSPTGGTALYAHTYAAAAEFDAIEGLILKQNTKYQLTVTDVSTSENRINVLIDWVENVEGTL